MIITFEEKLKTLRHHAKHFIHLQVKKAKGNLHLLPEDFDEINTLNDEDPRYELPRFSYISKHGYYNEYAIIRLTQNGSQLLLIGEGIGETDDTSTFSLDDISCEEVIYLATYLQNN